jgi:hypothetical protein
MLRLPQGAYNCLLNRVPKASAAHTTLLKAVPPEGGKGREYEINCDIETAGDLLQTAVDHCPAALERVKTCVVVLLSKPLHSL